MQVRFQDENEGASPPGGAAGPPKGSSNTGNNTQNAQSQSSSNDYDDTNVLTPPRASFPLRHSANPRQKVVLAPKHSPMGWEKLKKSKDLRQIPPSDFPLRLSKAQLAVHNTFADAWIALDGKIYNVTAYLDYHPGGENVLMPFLGKEAGAVFRKYHRWVNYERILDDCFLGFLET